MSSIGVPANTELARAFDDANPPCGEIHLDPGGVDVEAKRDDTELFDLLNGRLGTEEANN
jgi:hypothetical protein